MGLDDLVARIELLQARIRSHKAALRENETRTRMALIDPLMHALGWDVSDPGVVTPEYKVSGGWADYALLRPDGRLPAATVEAKKLGDSLASHRMQMLNYANAAGIDYAGLTDGDHWELYDVFKPGPVGGKTNIEGIHHQRSGPRKRPETAAALASKLGVRSAGGGLRADSCQSPQTVNSRPAVRSLGHCRTGLRCPSIVHQPGRNVRRPSDSGTEANGH